MQIVVETVMSEHNIVMKLYILQKDRIINPVFNIFITNWNICISIFPYMRFPRKNTINKNIISQTSDAIVVIIKLDKYIAALL